MKFIVLIPARYASTRFPGKPLAMLGNSPIIGHVCRRVAEACREFAVATDDTRIAEAVERLGYKAIMTSEKHCSGTDRIMEAYTLGGSDADVVINVQGDEPFISAEDIRRLMQCFEDNRDTQIATLVRQFPPSGNMAALEDPNIVKVTRRADGRALYFSRSVIPYVRNKPRSEWPSESQYYTHIGIYAYRADVLKEITRLAPSPLEKAESLEQLRWLQAGYDVMTILTNYQGIGIDTPADLEAARKMLMG